MYYLPAIIFFYQHPCLIMGVVAHSGCGGGCQHEGVSDDGGATVSL